MAGDSTARERLRGHFQREMVVKQPPDQFGKRSTDGDGPSSEEKRPFYRKDVASIVTGNH
jgi:hypothetical protein